MKVDQEIRIPNILGSQDLNGYHPAQGHILGLENLGQAAFADFLDQLIAVIKYDGEFHMLY
jgi:hypothetical protein